MKERNKLILKYVTTNFYFNVAQFFCAYCFKINKII